MTDIPLPMRWDGCGLSPIKKRCAVPECESSAAIKGWCKAHYARWYRHGDPTAGRVKEGEPLAFIQTALRWTESECLYWPNKTVGYPTVWLNGRKQIASRVVCAMYNGPPPSSGRWHAAHSCGKGHEGCVAPKHLRWATVAQNHHDRIAHGTANRGERHGISKLTNEDAKIVFARIGRGEAQRKIAKDFGVSQGHISRIKRGECWGWMTGVTP